MLVNKVVKAFTFIVVIMMLNSHLQLFGTLQSNGYRYVLIIIGPVAHSLRLVVWHFLRNLLALLLISCRFRTNLRYVELLRLLSTVEVLRTD